MLILASASPRRQELMELAGLEFICIPSNASEAVPEGIALEDVPEYLAIQKAESVLKTHPEDIVMGADTLIELEDVMYGKPKDEEDAFRMLKMLSGKTHHVYTGVALLAKNWRETFTTVTKVEFFALKDEEIWDYVHTGEPLDKAGAYGIQGKGALLVKRIQGDYHTVVGLPIGELIRHLRKRT